MSQFLDNQTRARLEAQCRNEARLVMVKMGSSSDELAKLDLVAVKYHARRTATAGTGSATLITMNLHLNNNEAMFVETLLHELAHTVCAIKYSDPVGHGDRWKHVMVLMGQKPQRCHSVDLSEAYPDKWRKVACKACKKNVLVSKKRVNQAKRGAVTQCACGGVLIVLTQEELGLAARYAEHLKTVTKKTYTLQCACQTFSVSKRRFNMVRRGKEYLHKDCGKAMRVVL